MRRREFITLLGGAAALAARGVARSRRKAPDHRVSGREHAFGLEPVDRRFCAAAARTRLDRGSEPLRSSIAGRRDAASAMPRSRPSSFGSRSTSSSRWEAQSPPQGRRHRSFPSSLRLRWTRLATGLVAILARPGGNVTGLSMQSTDLAGKRLELLREVLPGLRRLAIMANVGYPASVLEIGEVQAAARKLGLEVDLLEIRRAEDIVPAFGALKSEAQALYVCGDALVTANHARINALALARDCLRFILTARFSEAGGLMSYGANNADLFRRAGDYVDKILRGAKPATCRSSSRPNSSSLST